MHHPKDSAFAEDVPYTVVAVEPGTGPRMFGRLMSGEPRSGPHAGARAYRTGQVLLIGFDRSEP